VQVVKVFIVECTVIVECLIYILSLFRNIKGTLCRNSVFIKQFCFYPRVAVEYLYLTFLS